MSFTKEILSWIPFYFLIILGSAFFVAGTPLLFEHLSLPKEDQPKIITAYTDGVLQKNGQNYIFSFQFKTVDIFVEDHPIQVDVHATLPEVTSECVKIRFNGAANYSSLFNENSIVNYQNKNIPVICLPTVQNEIILYPMKNLPEYKNNQTLTIQYGINGNWGVWYINPQEQKTYADYVSDIIHISPAESLVQLRTDRLQNYFNTLVLSLTFIVSGATLLHLAIMVKPKKKRA